MSTLSASDAQLTLEATFYSREETQGHPPSTGMFGVTLEEARRGEGLLQCAVDPDVIPLLTEFSLRLWDNTEISAKALDIGTAIKGNIIDIFVDTVEEAINLGRKPVTALISGSQGVSS